ncbi:hypothetical protein IKF25_00090 [Candidatus Saccharibacteria bacterium]|nr:hypothetical protein [Candidatus Saccharibacteria bacterium]
MVKTKIILHPSKTALDKIFHANTKRYRFHFSQLNPSEIIAICSIIENYHPTTIIKIPEVAYPEKKRTPDFLIDGVRYEIKAPRSIHCVHSLYTKAKKQVRKNGFIVFEYMNIENASLFDFVEKTYKYCNRIQPWGFILMNHGNILYSTR